MQHDDREPTFTSSVFMPPSPLPYFQTMIRIAMSLSRALLLSFTDRIRFPASSFTTRTGSPTTNSTPPEMLAHFILARDLLDGVMRARILAIANGIIVFPFL